MMLLLITVRVTKLAAPTGVRANGICYTLCVFYLLSSTALACVCTASAAKLEMAREAEASAWAIWQRPFRKAAAARVVAEPARREAKRRLWQEDAFGQHTPLKKCRAVKSSRSDLQRVTSRSLRSDSSGEDDESH